MPSSLPFIRSTGLTCTFWHLCFDMYFVMSQFVKLFVSPSMKFYKLSLHVSLATTYMPSLATSYNTCDHFFQWLPLAVTKNEVTRILFAAVLYWCSRSRVKLTCFQALINRSYGVWKQLRVEEEWMFATECTFYLANWANRNRPKISGDVPDKEL